MANSRFFPGPVEIFQSTRQPSGAFSARVDITAQAGALNEDATDIGAVKIRRDLHLVVARGTTGTPGSLTEVAATQGPVGGEMVLAIKVCCTASNSDRLMYATRQPDGTWTVFQEFPPPREGAGGVDSLAVVAE